MFLFFYPHLYKKASLDLINLSLSRSILNIFEKTYPTFSISPQMESFLKLEIILVAFLWTPSNISASFTIRMLCKVSRVRFPVVRHTTSFQRRDQSLSFHYHFTPELRIHRYTPFTLSLTHPFRFPIPHNLYT